MVASVGALTSAGQAGSYYEADDYYAEGGLAPSEWACARMAASFGSPRKSLSSPRFSTAPVARRMRRDRRHQRFDQIAFASGVDMVAKWQAPVAFYDRLKKPVIAKIMTEVLGKSAADNCAKMKKGDLAAAAAERVAGRGWLPPALVIAEPPHEIAAERPVFDDEDEGDEDGEAVEFEEEEAA